MNPSEILILNPELSKVLTFPKTGFTSEQRKLLKQAIVDLENGTIDTLSFDPDTELTFEQASEIINSELDGAYSELGLTSPEPGITVTGRPYVGLHQDERTFEVESKTPVLRFHQSDGSETKTPNIPDGMDAKRFEAMFLLGRMRTDNPGPGPKPINDFEPSIIVGQTTPSWTLFRITGGSQYDASSVAHCVLPRNVIEVGMREDARFSAYSDENGQQVSRAQEKYDVAESRSSRVLGEINGEMVGVDRSFIVRDFSRSDLSGF